LKIKKTTEAFSKKKTVFLSSLEQMFKRTDTDLDTQPRATQHRLKFSLKNARLPLDGCCYLNDKGNKTLFTINISPPLTTTAGMNGEDQWLSLPGHRNSTMDFFILGLYQPLGYQIKSHL
jgi:hypothetical protein